MCLLLRGNVCISYWDMFTADTSVINLMEMYCLSTMYYAREQWLLYRLPVYCLLLINLHSSTYIMLVGRCIFKSSSPFLACNSKIV